MLMCRTDCRKVIKNINVLPLLCNFLNLRMEKNAKKSKLEKKFSPIDFCGRLPLNNVD